MIMGLFILCGVLQCVAVCGIVFVQPSQKMFAIAMRVEGREHQLAVDVFVHALLSMTRSIS